MPVDHLRYDVLVQEALRGMVRDVLVGIAKTKVLPGEHHFFITFATTAEGVRLSDRLHAQYPEDMTIVLQHQFWDLKVSTDQFEVGLSFGGVPERLVVPFEAIKAFSDPSVQFTLQFETLTDTPDENDEAETETKAPTRSSRRAPAARPAAKSSVPASPAPAAASTSEAKPAPDKADAKDDQGGDKNGGEKSSAEIVRLDRFRKK